MIAEAVVALLLVLSGALALAGAVGLARLPEFFLRMHAPSLAYTLGSWAITLASIVHFTAGARQLSLHVWLVVVLLAITVPVTTVLLARAALFRLRSQREPGLPPPLARTAGEDGAGAPPDGGS